ncbi:hypothetical protein EPI10_024904 [Gossypium australe]|uniref:Uncharacterized protein n=1 Tax=Gossypium australe TaxID=47621 RepID=A0A5B6W0E8_9ROSI|nr:hypothetical protein EPI10_024904 [Gossypium australe]
MNCRETMLHPCLRKLKEISTRHWIRIILRSRAVLMIALLERANIYQRNQDRPVHRTSQLPL